MTINPVSYEEIFFKNEIRGRKLIFKQTLCTGCGDCIEVCPQHCLQPNSASKRSVGWKVQIFPTPSETVCVECFLCLPQYGGTHIPCPWGACTMCDECTKICKTKAIYTEELK